MTARDVPSATCCPYPSANINSGAALTIEVDPNNSNHLLLGTMRGVTESFDGGQTWSDVAGTTQLTGGNRGDQLGLPVATITFDPTGGNRAYFANSWLIKNDLYVWASSGYARESDLFHEGRIYRQTPDGNWESVVFEPDSSQYMNVHSIAVNPADASQVFVAASTGVYRSNDFGAAGSWEKLDAPADTFGSMGIAISPDGENLYATYKIDEGYFGNKVNYDEDSKFDGPRSKFFAAKNTENVVWQDRSNSLNVSTSGSGSAIATGYWNPQVDQVDDGVDNILLGTLYGREGLWQASFTNTAADTVTDAQWDRILYKDGRKVSGIDAQKFDYSMGWDTASTLARRFFWEPTAWSGDGQSHDGIWSLGGQNIFRGDPGADGFPYTPASWTERYSQQVSEQVIGGKTVRTYSGRGIQSTVNWETASHGNYIIQAMADNGVVESFDGGVSWTRDRRPGSNARAAHVFDAFDKPIVLVAAGPGFGGGSADMRLHALVLETGTLQDQWINNVDQGLLPDKTYITDITATADGRGAYVMLSSEGRNVDGEAGNDYVGGVYYIDDVSKLVTGGASFTQITDLYGNKVQIDAANPDRLLVHGHPSGERSRLGLFEVTRQAGGDWTYTQIDTAVNDVTVWTHEGETYTAYTKTRASRGEVLGSDIYLADSSGNFSVAYAVDQADPIYDDILGYELGVTVYGLVGYQDKLYWGEGLDVHRKGLGMVQGELGTNADGDLILVTSNFSGSGDGRHVDPRIRRSDIIEINGKAYLATNNRGSGLLVRELGVAEEPQPEPEPDQGKDPFGGTPLQVTANGATLEFELFDLGGQGVAYNDTEARNYGVRDRPQDFRAEDGVDVQFNKAASGEYVVYRTREGEWLEYTLDVEAGFYDLDVLFSSKSNNVGGLSLEWNGQTVATLDGFTNTGNWRNYQNASAEGVYLPGGVGVLRAVVEGKGFFNLDAMSFTAVSAAAQGASVASSSTSTPLTKTIDPTINVPLTQTITPVDGNAPEGPESTPIQTFTASAFKSGTVSSTLLLQDDDDDELFSF